MDKDEVVETEDKQHFVVDPEGHIDNVTEKTVVTLPSGETVLQVKSEVSEKTSEKQTEQIPVREVRKQSDGKVVLVDPETGKEEVVKQGQTVKLPSDKIVHVSPDGGQVEVHVGEKLYVVDEKPEGADSEEPESGSGIRKAEGAVILPDRVQLVSEEKPVVAKIRDISKLTVCEAAQARS